MLCILAQCRFLCNNITWRLGGCGWSFLSATSTVFKASKSVLHRLLKKLQEKGTMEGCMDRE